MAIGIERDRIPVFPVFLPAVVLIKQGKKTEKDFF